MQPLVERIVRMRGSGIREIMDLASRTEDVKHLEVGQPGFNTPPHIIEAAYKALKEGYTGYTPNAGYPSLREEIARRMTEERGLSVRPEQIVVTTGAVFAIAAAVLTIADVGDEVLVSDPAWPNYALQLRTIGAVPVYHPLHPEKGYLPQVEDLESCLTERTKAVILNSPNNPTGAVYPEETLRAIVDFAHRHDLYVISDEVYDEFVFEGEHVSPAAFDADGRVVTIGGFSKTYAMTGWRIGYAIASPDIHQGIWRLTEPFISCAPAVSQKAAEAALRGPQDCVEEMREAYRVRRDRMVEILGDFAIPHVHPRGSFYIMCDISASGADSYTFCKELVREARVGAAPGLTFGPQSGRYVRLCFAPDLEEVEEGTLRLGRYLRQRSG